MIADLIHVLFRPNQLRPEAKLSTSLIGIVALVAAIAGACFGTWSPEACLTVGALSCAFLYGASSGRIGFIALPSILGFGMLVASQPSYQSGPVIWIR